MSKKYPFLFSPLSLGSKKIKNRIVVSAHNTGMDRGGQLNMAYVDYLVRRARGGAGLIIAFGAANVYEGSGKVQGRISLWDDDNSSFLKKIADGAHDYGSLIMAQVAHIGRRGRSVASEVALQAPSEIPEPWHGEVPHCLTVKEIRDIIRSFVTTAEKLVEYGWDGVEITSFGGQLIEQFWSPRINNRTDEYGATFQGRMRFSVEVVRAVKAAVPEDFIIGFRLTGDPYTQDLGLSSDDMLTIARTLDELDCIDFFDVSGGTGATFEAQSATVPPDTYERGCHIPLACRMRQALSVPVMAAGRILDPGQAEAAIADGDCDLVAMTRATIADPDLPNWAAQGAEHRVRPCIAINDACIGRSFSGLPIRCAVNPGIGHSDLESYPNTDSPKTVIIVGAGPAGMEAARVATMRGHKVTVLERQRQVGGQIVIAAENKHRPHLGRHVVWLAAELERLRISVRLECEANAKMITNLQPDIVILATGAKSIVPDHIENSLGKRRAVTDVDLLQAKVKLQAGKNAVIYDREGGIRGGMAAICAAEMGGVVTFATPLQAPSIHVDPIQKPFILSSLANNNINAIPHQELVSFDGEYVVMRNVWSQKKQSLPCALLVCVGYNFAVASLHEELQREAPDLPIHLVGDSYAPRTLRDAVREAAEVGSSI